MLIGFLGEKNQFDWWNCSFLSPTSHAFLNPIFPKSLVQAQYTGVCQAATIFHDEHIGLGQNYHLYRLPDPLEQLLFASLKDKDFTDELKDKLKSTDEALSRLKQLGGSSVDKSEGPVVIGDFSDSNLTDMTAAVLSHYLSAFEHNYKTFPYFRTA